jgi:broad specificity phosphatase PhoE
LELYLLRHGQSTNNLTLLSDPNVREPDPPLTETGQQQAQRAADHLANGLNLDQMVQMPPELREDVRGFGITRIYSSPMQRALQTAQPVSAALGLPVEVWVNIHEHGGVYLAHDDGRGVVGYPGLTRAQMQTAYPDYVLPPEVTESGWWHPARGHESISDSMGRAIGVAYALRQQASSDQRILLVTHGTFSDLLVKALCNTLPADDLRHLFYNTALSCLDFQRDGRVVVRYLNRTDHLPPALLT